MASAGLGAGTRISLGARVRRAERRQQLLMLGLMAPTMAFVAFFFVAPIVVFLFRAVDNPEIPVDLARTVQALAGWDAGALPSEDAYAALAEDLAAIAGTTALPLLGRRLNYNIPGYRGLIMTTGNALPDGPIASWKDTLIEIDPRWGELEYWAAIKNQDRRLTLYYLLNALDLEYLSDGSIARVPAERALFLDLYGRTFWISAWVTLLCLAIGFPVASVMAASTPAVANLLFMLVLIPFWTSLLVRTTAWVILLQNEGLVNQTLIALGLLGKPAALIFNRTGVYIAMVHILLPYMVLPIYSVLRGIQPEHARAAASLGARPSTVFRRIYLPLALPGIAAGCTLVFVLSIGFYVTPALVGGPGDQMVGYFIAYFTNSAVNWGMASALGAMLLAIIACLYLVLGRMVGFERLKVR